MFNKFFLRNKNFSFRHRKITRSNINILKSYWPIFGINLSNCIDNTKNYFFFSKKFQIKKKILEIGFGSGDFLVHEAFNNKHIDFIGIEIYIPGIISCIKKILLKKINNVFIIYHDATKIVKNFFLNESFLKINIFFPDPWKKNKHRKRRIIDIVFLKIIYKKILFNGELNIITDCKNYYLNIKKLITNKNFFSFKKNIFYKNNIKDINTKFFIKAKKKKSKIYFLNYIKKR